ncbi:MAG: riboflavin synthase, partial [Terrimesophilobacter sp.]
AVSDAHHGDSISVNGVCLTVVDQGTDWFTADVMAETITMSTLKHPRPGDQVNLERAAKVGDRIGGHIVQGHIDGTATVISITDGSAWRVVRFSLAPELASLVVRKGSIALDGVSLTVSAVGRDASTDDSGDWFEVSLIPETLAVTTLGFKTVGDLVNVETDILARHVERMLAKTEQVTKHVGSIQGVAGSAGIHGHDSLNDPHTPLVSRSIPSRRSRRDPSGNESNERSEQ